MLKKEFIKSRKVSKVTFEITADEMPATLDVESVNLVGDFNEWNIAATPMEEKERSKYSVTLELQPGHQYQFRYLVNNKHWCNDWHADAYVSNGYGQDNCLVVTPDRIKAPRQRAEA